MEAEVDGMALLFELVATLSFDMVHPGGVKEEAHLNSKKDVTKQASINEVCGSNSIALRYTVDVPLYPRPSGPRRSFSELCRERRFARACCLFALPPRNVMMQLLDPPVPRARTSRKRLDHAGRRYILIGGHAHKAPEETQKLRNDADEFQHFYDRSDVEFQRRTHERIP